MDPIETQELEELEEEFNVSKLIIIYKFVLGLLEFLLGLSITLFGKKAILYYQNFKSNELLEDPHDLLVLVSEKIIPYFMKHRYYVILVLVILGLAKMIGAVGLVYKKVWALDLLLFVTMLILPFQAISFLVHPSVFDLVYVLIGIFIIFWLVNFKPKEYIRKLKKRMAKKSN